MTKPAGRKARDDRYYRANRDAISQRRRERRRREKERAEFGIPQLTLVEGAFCSVQGSNSGGPHDHGAPCNGNLGIPASDVVANADGVTDRPVTDHVAVDPSPSDVAPWGHPVVGSEPHSQTSTDCVATDYGATDTLAADGPPTDTPVPAYRSASVQGATDHDASQHEPSNCTATDLTVADHGKTEAQASNTDEPDFWTATDQDASKIGPTINTSTDLDTRAQPKMEEHASDYHAPNVENKADKRASDQRLISPSATDSDLPSIMISYETMERPQMDNLQFPSHNVYSFPRQPTSRPMNTTDKIQSNFSVLFALQLVVTLGLATLGIFLQVEFYQAHDVLPGYAWPLALAGAASMLALATTKFDKWMIDLCRKLVYGCFYLFMVLSSSYHVLSGAWVGASKVVSTREARESDEQSGVHEETLAAVTKALNVATQKGAWKAMESLASAIPRSIPEKLPVPEPKPFGISGESMIAASAVILIVLRALLESAQALTAVAVRDYILKNSKTK